jgi:hypothetical protein
MSNVLEYPAGVAGVIRRDQRDLHRSAPGDLPAVSAGPRGIA